MKRVFLTFALGLIAGVGSYLGYFHFNEPATTDSLEGQLAWMRTELHLTDAQFARIKELHRASHPQLQAMAAQVSLMQAEFSEFEQTRRTSDRVDFVEFAHFVETRRNLNQACLDSTRRLVLASAEVMTPSQRRQYLQLVATAEPLAGSILN